MLDQLKYIGRAHHFFFKQGTKISCKLSSTNIAGADIIQFFGGSWFSENYFKAEMFLHHGSTYHYCRLVGVINSNNIGCVRF